MVKIIRKSEENHEARFQNFTFLMAKNRYFVVIAFKLPKMEFKFKYTVIIMKLQTIWPVHFSKS